MTSDMQAVLRRLAFEEIKDRIGAETTPREGESHAEFVVRAAREANEALGVHVKRVMSSQRYGSRTLYDRYGLAVIRLHEYQRSLTVRDQIVCACGCGQQIIKTNTLRNIKTKRGCESMYAQDHYSLCYSNLMVGISSGSAACYEAVHRLDMDRFLIMSSLMTYVMVRKEYHLIADDAVAFVTNPEVRAQFRKFERRLGYSKESNLNIVIEDAEVRSGKLKRRR